MIVAAVESDLPDVHRVQMVPIEEFNGARA
jgi:hypothetical protein